MGNRRTTEEFIQEAKKKHGDKYDYSLVDYKDSYTAVKIICPDHGVFEQKPNGHLQRRGCSWCAGNQKSGNEYFIQEAKKKHGDKYDYSLVEYIKAHAKVKIICPDHGVFEQKPNNHLSGHGCRLCAGNQKLDNKKFIDKARFVHGDKYDYSLTRYQNSHGRVKIICPDHGVFEQIADVHWFGSGCWSCASHGFDRAKSSTLYLLRFTKPFVTFWKIGITNKSIKKRFKGEFKFIDREVVWEFPIGADAYHIEQMVLNSFKQYKFNESFIFNLLDCTGGTECFVPSLPERRVIRFVNHQIKKLKSDQDIPQCP